VLMRKLGQKRLILQLPKPLPAIPESLSSYKLELGADGTILSYTFDAHGNHDDIPRLLKKLAAAHVDFTDLHTEQSSLEDIFMGLLNK
jgi:ABC-2 type transport system ATP-binding protein